jgi:hypothetical protein
MEYLWLLLDDSAFASEILTLLGLKDLSSFDLIGDACGEETTVGAFSSDFKTDRFLFEGVLCWLSAFFSKKATSFFSLLTGISCTETNSV